MTHKQDTRLRTGALLAGLGAGLWLASLARRQSRRISFEGKTVVITGGSRGLGLEMARELAGEQANLAILARNEPDLEAARSEVASLGTRVIAIPCDVGDQAQVNAAIQKVMDAYGRIDVLVNNAGIIQVAPLDHMKIKDYQDAMDVHFWGPLYTMLAVIPIMRRQGSGGRIVNIASIGGKVAVPHLAPYVASKFALDGLSDTFRAELARDGILVSTVNPGLMRTGSYYQANFKGDHEREFAWFTLLASTPATAMSSKRAARQVISAARYGIPERVLTVQARLMQVAEEIAPGLMAWIMKTTNRFLPGPAGPRGELVKTGFESRSKVAPSKITKMGDEAAERNNEMLAERLP